MRALITGVQGFVGKYLANQLLSQGIEVWGTSRKESPLLCLEQGNVKVIQNDLNNMDEIFKALNDIKPDYIFHLAGQSNVKCSWDRKEETFYANVNKTIFLLDASVKYQIVKPSMRLLTIGSSEEYGHVVADEFPIKETTALRPMSPYGTSKAAVSMLIQQYHKAHGLNVIHARPFNHIGHGQTEQFVVPSFVNQVKAIIKEEKQPVIEVGNLEAMRDFLDVKDVVDAYFEILSKGQLGEIYNVCSGEGRQIKSLLEMLIQLSGKKITIQVDTARLRAVDIPIYTGDNSKIKANLNWLPKIKIEETLKEMLGKN